MRHTIIIVSSIQLQVSKTMEPQPSIGNVFLTVNGINGCRNVTISNNDSQFEIESNRKYSLPSSDDWYLFSDNCNIDKHLNLSLSRHGYMIGYFSNILKQNDTNSIEQFSYPIEKATNGRTRIYILIDNSASEFVDKRLYAIDNDGNVNSEQRLKTGNFIDIFPPFYGSNRYQLSYGSDCGQKMKLSSSNNSNDDNDCVRLVEISALMGSVHTIEIDGYGDATLTKIIRENDVSLLWQLPQYLSLTVGEVLFSVTDSNLVIRKRHPI